MWTIGSWKKESDLREKFGELVAEKNKSYSKLKGILSRRFEK